MIHEFSASETDHFDEDGDLMLGFYFQFTDEDDLPVTGLIGPYSYNGAAEKAALRAFKSKDF